MAAKAQETLCLGIEKDHADYDQKRQEQPKHDYYVFLPSVFDVWLFKARGLGRQGWWRAAVGVVNEILAAAGGVFITRPRGRGRGWSMVTRQTMLPARWLAREAGHDKGASERNAPGGSGSGSKAVGALAGEPAGEYRRILVATDFSPCSTRAVERATALAERFGAALTVLHVIDVNIAPTCRTAAELMRSLSAKAEAEMRRLAAWLDGRVDARGEVEEGLPAEVVVEKSKGYDLVVLGRKEPRAKWKLFARHTAERVARGASCPVMVVGGSAWSEAVR